MGILLYSNNNKFYASYKTWNKIKSYLGIASLKILYNQNNNSVEFYETINYLLQNQETVYFLNNLLLFYENNMQNTHMLQGIYDYIKQNKSSHLYSSNESITFINSIDAIKPELNTDYVLNTYIDNIYDIHKYSIEHNCPVFIT